MSDLLKKGIGGRVNDSARPRPCVWWIPLSDYDIERNLDRLKSRIKLSSFNVKFCYSCNKAFEYYFNNGMACTVIEYYSDFPSISCQKETCPKCL
tara:strand:+ start:4520 stop:4804 length:285 start_codon:yes stop_codon:yes gene_type:complete